MMIPIWVLVISKYNKEDHECTVNENNLTSIDQPEREFWMLVTFSFFSKNYKL